MATTLKASTKILELTKTYPFLFDTLVGISPKLKRLQNPILQKTIGKRATLTDVSKMADIPLNRLFEKLAKSISDNTSDSVVINKEDKEIGEWQEELQRRQRALKDLILELHRGEDLEGLQAKFKEILKDVSATEIAEMEQSLISSGELTAEQVTALCDLHVLVFKESLDVQQTPETTPGHPIHTYMCENKEAQKLVDHLKANPDDKDAIEELGKIVVHYTRLQNQLFPMLESRGITGPSTVMWAKQDEIREMINSPTDSSLGELLAAVEDLIYKENNILFPTALENLSEYDWVKVRVGEEEIGYAWITPGAKWEPITPMDIHQTDQTPSSPEIKLNTGSLTLKEVDLVLRHLPFDMSFVGVDEEVKYYSATDDRIFPRSPGVIGRSVINCHPRKSFDKVQRIMKYFKQGKKDKAVFWIQMKERFILISYFAVRDDNGEFVGTLEVSQDVTDIRSLEGEQRLLDWD
ncbi:MAG: DUF438 domain-containing protein [Candidatus Thorarchaeota archaeon]|nr:MAG: DUF438 domain-containing protein [Candidatus Thorarchaeota archaeon]